jgi:ATP-binding cassette subfamily F protein 3
VLQRALGDYTGAFAIVSHNRSFLDPIVTKVLEFIPGQKPKLYYGNVSDYLEKKKADMELEAVRANPPAAGGVKSSANSTAGSVDSGANRKEQRRLDAKAREERAQKLRPLKKEFEALEAEVAKLEKEKDELDGKLADPEFFKKGDDASTAMKRYSEVETLLESRVAKWGELSDKIEKLEAEG